MNRILTLAAISAAALTVASCSESAARRESYAIETTDRDAEIVCRTMGEPFLMMRTRGRIVFDTTGRIEFIDATSGRFIKTEGECTIAYALDSGVTPPLDLMSAQQPTVTAPAPRPSVATVTP